MQLNIVGAGGGESQATTDIADSVFGRQDNPTLVHQVVTAYFAGARQGSRANLSRGDVRASGRKPWRQKRTGRARAGSVASPLWRGGGVTFAATPGTTVPKVNRRAYRAAISTILSTLLRAERLQVVAELAIAEPRTRLLLEQLAAFSWSDVLLVLSEDDRHLSLAARNLPKVDVCTVEELNPVILIRHDRVAFTLDALKKTEQWLI